MRTLTTHRYASAFFGTLLAVAFAAVAFGVQTFETWFPQLEAHVGAPLPVTVRLPSRYFRITMLRDEFHFLATSSSTCSQLIPRGTVLKSGEECTGLVRAYETERRQAAMSSGGRLGVFTFYLVIGLILVAFMRHPSLGRARLRRAQATVFFLLGASMISSKALLLLTSFPAQILPVVFGCLLISYFFKKRLAFPFVFVSSLLAASINNFDFQHFLVYSMSGMSAVVSFGLRRRAASHLKAGALASWIAVAATLITTLIFSGTLQVHDDMAEHIDPRYSLWLAALIGGFGSGVIAFVLTPLVGALVGEVSRSRLLDLQDLDQPLLRLLRERAPGTWEHSRAMANLAEAATHAIGGNSLLARVGAYYHDVGKSLAPEYFIENQGRGQNPHDSLDPAESVKRIFRHVVEGTRMLRKEGIPEDVVQFSFSHHGTSVIEFFWHKALANGSPNGPKDKDFQYPGHRPMTRETGIVMIVDAIEAAARTIDEPDKHGFQQLVQRIVFSKLAQGQLDEAGLSVADLRLVINTLVDTLVNMYHSRIKYPWQQTGDSSSSNSKKPDAAPQEPVPHSPPRPTPTQGTPVISLNATSAQVRPDVDLKNAVPGTPTPSHGMPVVSIAVPPAGAPALAGLPQSVGNPQLQKDGPKDQ